MGYPMCTFHHDDGGGGRQHFFHHSSHIRISCVTPHDATKLKRNRMTLIGLPRRTCGVTVRRDLLPMSDYE